ncbi:MAG: glutamate racemase [Alphaproteobacteria bacterium]|nr:glutamate racemase [Alphaproteobacteria bacterium]
MAPLPSLPIGVFDSGVGGLTVLDAIAQRLPSEDLLYLGDTARVPYGTRSPLTVRRYASRVASHLWGQGIKALVIACNTATAHALDDLIEAGDRVGLPVLGVIEPGVAVAAAQTRSGHVGVIGTEGTIRAGRYQAALEARGLTATGLPCPLFVPLAEEGWTEGEVAALVAERYLAPLRGGPDTLILGCTHFPLLRGVVAAALPGVEVIDSAHAAADAVAAMLDAQGLLRDPSSAPGQHRFQVTDNLERFHVVGERFLQRDPGPVQLVDLPEPAGPFLSTRSG